MKKRILVVSSANMDFVMKVSKLPDAGQTVIERQSYSYVPGGKGANSALALARLGADSIFCARLGYDANGKKLKELYDSNGIDTRFLKLDRMNPTGLASIIVEDNGANRIVVYPGANDHLSEDDVEDAMTCLPDAVFMQFEIPEEAAIAAAKFAAKRKIPVFVDAGPAKPDTPLEKLPPLEVISPNETETEALTGVFPNDSANCLKAANELLKRVEFTAALTLEYLNTRDIVKAVKYANTVGAMVVSKAGASTSLPTAAQVEEFMRQRGIAL